MDSKAKLNALSHAYVTKKVADERKKIKVLNDNVEELPKEVHNALLDIQFKLNEQTGTFEIDYEIMADACQTISSNAEGDPETLRTMEFNENDSASVYTSTRLGYLNLNNQAEISAIMKEYEAEDIATACAIWYDQQVATACQMLVEWILEV